VFLGQNYHDQSKAEHAKTTLALKVKGERKHANMAKMSARHYSTPKNKIKQKEKSSLPSMKPFCGRKKFANNSARDQSSKC